MPFVHKDTDGKILAVYTEPVEGAVEVAPNDPELVAFIHQNIPGVNVDEWVQSDLGLARVLEDLIQVLIDRKVIMFTDFPPGAQGKLRARRGLRREFSVVEELFGEQEFGTGEGEDSGSGYL
ncbi:MAG: hypothetical protein HYW28_12880 [Rhodospirillales bacterium]|nr:hypothetical protein [Rhodospirillales bacterium]MBI2586745.1 hypothetical protein [Rhodospirillales bacterium]